MKYWLNLLVSLTLAGMAQAAELNPDTDLAVRGDGVVTHEQFNARLDRVKPQHRFPFIRDRRRMEDTLEQMLTAAQLAAAAKAAGFDQEAVIVERMKLAADEELAKAWLDHIVQVAEAADYTAMAREEFQLNRERYKTAPTVDVTHILIKDEDRSTAEALELASDLHARLVDDPALFDRFVEEYSEDSSKSSNDGRFKGVGRGEMVPAFEEASFSMEVGTISEPVKTPYGYHLIRKDDATASRQMRFGEVRQGLEVQMRNRHEERVKENYLGELYREEMLVTETSVENAIERVFGPDVLAKYQEDGEAP